MTSVVVGLWCGSLAVAFGTGMWLQAWWNKRHIKKLAELVRLNKINTVQQKGRW